MKKIYSFVVCLLISPALPAADFVFNVPLQLDRIPKGVPQAKVTCEVFTYRDTINPIASGYRISSIDSRSGYLHQDIHVDVNFHSMQRHRKPHQYTCKMQLLVPWAQPSWQTPAEHAVVEAIRPRKGARLISTVSGLMP